MLGCHPDASPCFVLTTTSCGMARFVVFCYLMGLKCVSIMLNNPKNRGFEGDEKKKLSSETCYSAENA